jgi:dTDP-glucose 4,6-dehydratase
MCAWTVSLPLAVSIRYDFQVPPGDTQQALLVGLGCGIAFVLVGQTFRLHRGRYVVGSFDEIFGVLFVTLVVGVLCTLGAAFDNGIDLPRSTPMLGSATALVIMLGGRFAWRNSLLHSALGRSGSKTLILGAGDAGQQVANLLLSDRSLDSRPIGFIDDDPDKRRLRRAGLKVLGNTSDLELIVKKYDVKFLLVAIAGVSARQLFELDRRCKQLNVAIRLIPTASEIVGGAVRLGDISDVTEEDLLGRKPIETNEQEITRFLKGRRILVTGAGGSIGSELVRQIARYSPSSLMLLDRDESALHAAQLTLDATGTLTADTLVLADIRDEARLLELFRVLRPEIVFHAAALKHLPLLQRYPSEAYKTNIIGTRNVLQAAHASGVEVFVNISTDKAADPTSVLGYSKLATERLTAGTTVGGDRKCVSVRFGNVLGSRGSVLHTFRFQIANGGPVTVTDERVTRYFMTVGEAVHLVLQAAVIGNHGETLILDMGDPVKIADVARYMIQRSGREIELVFTGLREGEKLDETLVGDKERVAQLVHPQISHTKVAPLKFNDFPLSVDSDKEALEYLFQANSVAIGLQSHEET